MNYSIDYQGDMGGSGGNGGGYRQQQHSSPHPSQSQQQQQRPARKAYDEQTLIPVTIAMLHKSAAGIGGDLELSDGRPIHHVKLIGAVRSAEEQSTNVTFQIEDCTGLIEAKQWLDDNDCTAAVAIRKEAQQDHVYVRVVGQMKDYNNHKVLVAHSVRRITDLNAMTHHYLETVFSAEQHKRGDRIGGAPLAPGAMPQGQGVAVQQQTGGGGGGSDLKEKILSFIKVEGEGTDVGAPIDRCVGLLTQNGFSDAEIRAAIEELSSEGHIYSTIDENHYQFAY